jgi:heparan-alpha-glucosaminide N-acetyltransferase
MQQLPKRLLSIDVLRAITMLLMIFVNDASGVRHIPEWIDHAKGFEDRMGFADTIFPAFLFIVGLSLPFAINNRIKKGDNARQVLFYILIRSVALLVMGFYHVNLEDYNSAAAVISKAGWAIIITTAFFLIWLDYPESMAKAKKNGLQVLGIVMLVAMAVIYKGGEDGEVRGMEPSWWGILGLIGWSYLVCALIFFAVKGKLNSLIVAWVILAAINILAHCTLKIKIDHHASMVSIAGNDITGSFLANAIVFLKPLWIIHDASTMTLTMGGVVISGIYAKLVEQGKTQRIWATLAIVGILLLVAGFAIRPYAEGISKIRSTPAWVFICSGITTLAFLILIYVVDVKGKIKAFKWIKPAGTSTLTCYLIPYFQVFILELLHINYPSVINNGLPGLLRSFLTAVLIILFVGLLEKKRLRLKI